MSENLNTVDENGKVIKPNKLIALLIYVVPFIGILLAGLYHKEDEYLKQQIKNAVVIMIAGVAAALLACIPIIGWIAMAPALGFVAFCEVWCIVYVFMGKITKVPLLSKISWLELDI